MFLDCIVSNFLKSFLRFKKKVVNAYVLFILYFKFAYYTIQIFNNFDRF